MADLHGVLASYVADGSLPGAVAVIAGGDRTEVAVVGSVAVGGGPMTRDAIFRFASITKPIVAAAVFEVTKPATSSSQPTPACGGGWKSAARREATGGGSWKARA